MGGGEKGSSLVLVAGGRACGVPVAHVVETMRRLRVEAAAGMPSFVLGLSIIRGAAVPVIDLAAVLGDDPSSRARLVLVRLGDRRLALAADDVVGVRAKGARDPRASTSLLAAVHPSTRAALASLDADFVSVLQDATIDDDSALTSGAAGADAESAT